MKPRTPAELFRIRLSVASLSVYLVVVLVMTLGVAPVDRQLAGEVASLLARLRAQGLPDYYTFTNVEALANVTLFLPLGALVTLCFRVHKWWIAPVGALLLSVGIEGAQLLFLPGRVATWTDVVANTLGALLGTVAALILRLLVRRRDRLLGQAFGPGRVASPPPGETGPPRRVSTESSVVGAPTDRGPNAIADARPGTPR